MLMYFIVAQSGKSATKHFGFVLPATKNAGSFM